MPVVEVFLLKIFYTGYQKGLRKVMREIGRDEN